MGMREHEVRDLDREHERKLEREDLAKERLAKHHAVRDFAEACKRLECAQLSISCAENQAHVRNAVDAARQALQIIVSNAEVIWP